MRRFAAVGLPIHLHWHSKGPKCENLAKFSLTSMLQGSDRISQTVSPFLLLSLLIESLEWADQARGKQCARSCTRTWSRAIVLCKNLSHWLPEKTNFWSDWPIRLLFFLSESCEWADKEYHMDYAQLCTCTAQNKKILLLGSGGELRLFFMATIVLIEKKKKTWRHRSSQFLGAWVPDYYVIFCQNKCQWLYILMILGISIYGHMGQGLIKRGL